MEKEFSGGKPAEEAVLDESSRLGGGTVANKMGQCPLDEPVSYTLPPDCLLTYATYHLTQIDWIALGTA